MKANVTIQSKDFKATTFALINSGATDNFISPYIVNRHILPQYQLPRPRIVRNVDGSINSMKEVTHMIVLRFNYKEQDVFQCFFIINLGTDDMILGYTVLEASNPTLDWTTGIIPGEIYAYTFDADEWTPKENQKHLDCMNVQGFLDSKEEEYIPNDDYIPFNERGIIQNPDYYARRTTMATQLAINNLQQPPFRFTTKKVSETINDKQIIKPITWKHAIPPEYHRYGKVFSEQEAQRFPKPKPYDYAIDLLPDAPQSLDCKVYPSAPGEQVALDAFLKEHLLKKYVRHSKSPYATSTGLLQIK
jgi:hypothetical protein